MPDAEDATEKTTEAKKKFRFSTFADAFVVFSAAIYATAALAMTAISVGLILNSIFEFYRAFLEADGVQEVLLDAVSSLVISVAILDVAKYVMEEEVRRSRELRKPSEARESITKFIVIIALVLAIEGIVLVFGVGKSAPGMLMYPILLLIIPVVMIVGLGILLRLSVRAETSLARKNKKRD